MKTEDLEKRLPQQDQLLHVSIGKGGHVSWALARNKDLDGRPGRVSIIFDHEGRAFVLRFRESEQTPDEMKNVKQINDHVVEVNGWDYTRNGMFDLK